MKTRIGLTIGGVSTLMLLLFSCGYSVQDSNGSESHWLRKCETDAACASGECLCGM
jgi:hypothetical protein